MVGRFSIWLRKIKHTLTDEPHYALLLTWPEIQELIDVTDELESKGATSVIRETATDLCGKISEQFKWHAETRSDTPK